MQATERMYVTALQLPLFVLAYQFTTVPRLYPRPDLRELQKPAFSHLSRAFAGQPGDEYLDIAHIRDEWILTEMDKAKDKYSKPHTIK